MATAPMIASRTMTRPATANTFLRDFFIFFSILDGAFPGICYLLGVEIDDTGLSNGRITLYGCRETRVRSAGTSGAAAAPGRSTSRRARWMAERPGPAAPGA